MSRKYDAVIVGAGLFGSVVARRILDGGGSVLVLDRRGHIGGNCYTREVESIQVHEYGAHIFRTSDRSVWDFMNRFCEFNGFVNSPVANWRGELYNLPFNMNTFYALWGARTPDEARMAIERTRVPCDDPANLEEHVLDLVGRDVYEKLIRGYTEKQWGRLCSELPPSIMRRIPLRFTFDNNYFNDRWQGVPCGGYTALFERMLEGAEVRLNVDWLDERDVLRRLAPVTVFTGPIDEYFGYALGSLGYRGLRFEHDLLDEGNHQGVAVMNWTDAEVPYTRTIEHKHFDFGVQEKTVLTREYPAAWEVGDEPYYPMEDDANRALYARYAELAEREEGVMFGGRLGEYRYYDMQDTVRSALAKAARWFG